MTPISFRVVEEHRDPQGNLVAVTVAFYGDMKRSRELSRARFAAIDGKAPAFVRSVTEGA